MITIRRNGDAEVARRSASPRRRTAFRRGPGRHRAPPTDLRAGDEERQEPRTDDAEGINEYRPPRHSTGRRDADRQAVRDPPAPAARHPLGPRVGQPAAGPGAGSPVPRGGDLLSPGKALSSAACCCIDPGAGSGGTDYMATSRMAGIMLGVRDAPRAS